MNRRQRTVVRQRTALPGFALAILLVASGAAADNQAQPGEAEIDFAVAYYPYHQKLRCRVDLSKLSAARMVERANIVLTREGDEKQLAVGTISQFTGLPKRRLVPAQEVSLAGEVVVDTPDLKTGTYVATLTLAGGEGVPREPIVRTFERKVWEWEHNPIGLSRKVIPPFTPLRVVRNDDRFEVDSILRSHRLSDLCLWEQVTSMGHELLAAPIRFEASTQGGPVPWKSAPLKVVEESPDRAAIEAPFEGGPIRGTVTSEFDYDGMMKVTLNLAPAGKEPIESLDLLVPLKDAVATLMHVSGDSIRENYVGAAPPGTGVVWVSKGANGRGHKYGGIYGTFLPYVWLGGPERGICWFADSDRDWSLDDEQSALDLVRAEGALTLRVHLINKPTVLDRARKIVFGLQATPVKPMPANWRGWHLLGGRYPNTLRITILGQCLMWGAEEDHTAVYPRKRDFALFDEFARSRRSGNPFITWVDKSGWLDGYTDQTRREEFRSNVASGIGAQDTDRVTLYTDARGGEDSTCEEAINYNPRPLANNQWDEPIRSFQDFALFYFKQMMERGNVDGIYLDNAYATGNWDTISAGAHVRDDGTLQPSMGIFSIREYVKRIALMYHEAGRTPYTVVHMTNANLIPAFSFATIALDWEHKYGPRDFQDKFSRDYILAESIGRQAGLVPAGLNGLMSVTRHDEEFTRLARTQFGVALVHEVKIWGYANEVQNVYRHLYEFGYGQDDCTVYPYWEGNQPITVEGSDTAALVLSRRGEALVVVTDFGTGGRLSMKVDEGALGLKPDFTATDAETGKTLDRSDGNVHFDLNKHDFRVLILK